MLHNLATDADAHVAMTPGIRVSINGYFVLIYAVRPGRYTSRLPRTAGMVNLKTGHAIASATDRVELEADAKWVYWLRLDDLALPGP